MTSHRERLEAELLAEFDRRHPRRRRARARWAPLLAAAALAAGLLLAARAPAGYDADLGQRVEVRLPRGSELRGGAELAALIRDGLAVRGGGERQVEVRRMVDAGGETLRVDAWGAPIDGVVERLRARVPSLSKAEITVSALSGRVRTNVLGLTLRVLKLKSDPEAIEAARRSLQAQLGAGADVQIDVAPDGRRRVRVEVKRGAEGRRGEGTKGE